MKGKITRWSAVLLLACVCLCFMSCREREAIMIRLSDDIAGTWKAVYNDDGDYILLVLEKNGSGYYRRSRVETGPRDAECHFTYTYDSDGAHLHIVTNDKTEKATVRSLTTYSLVLQGWPYGDNWIFTK